MKSGRRRSIMADSNVVHLDKDKQTWSETLNTLQKTDITHAVVAYRNETYKHLKRESQ